jgi:exportin-7
VRATKIGWFDGDAQQGIVKDVVTFLSQPSSGVYLLGLKILNALVVEMNTPSGGYSLIVQRKTAVSFRDTALLNIFNISLTSLRQLREGSTGLMPGPDDRLTEMAVGLILKCLSFDFVGTSLDESAEDLGTIQVPSSWRPALEEPRTMALLLSTYAASAPTLSCACLECLVRLASVRRSLFASEAERAGFLGRLLCGTADILRARTGLSEHANYHEFCRLLGRLKTNYQLSELVAVDGWHDWIALVAEFTVTSLQSWQWAAGSVYYLLCLWSRLVASVPYLKGDAPSLLDAYVPRITETYITSRLESVAAVAASDGSIDDPLEAEEQLSEQLESLPQLCRFQYEATCGYLCSLLDPLLQRYGEMGPAAGAPGVDGPLGVLEGQLTWLVYIVGAVIRGRLSSATAESQEAVDGELALRVFQLIRVMEAPGHAGRTTDSRQRMELAVLGFFQNFRKVYVGEQAMHSSRVYVPLSERLGLHDHLAVLNACVAKISANLGAFAACPPVVEASLGLLSDLAAGYMSGKLLLKLDAIAFALSSHTEAHFPFLREPANARSRTVFYATLGRLLFMEEAPARFKVFMAPFDGLCAQLAAAAADPHGAFRAPQTRAHLIGLFRDLRGVVSATNSRRTYGLMFEWIYPAHTPLLHAAMAAYADDPGVAVPLLKLASELALNKTQRCTFDTSSVNGILLFREVSRLVCTYGARVLAAPRGGPDPYAALYKGIWAALTVVSRALAGNYVNFGVFELYGDPALKDALECAFAMCVSISPADVLAFRKVGRAYFGLLEVLSTSHIRAVLCTDATTFGHVAACLEAGLKCLDVAISSQCASAIDALAGFYFNALPVSEASPPAAQAAARHLGAMPHLFPELLRALFEMVLFEDCTNQWSLSRPMLSLILVNEAIFNELKAQLVASQPPDRQARLAACFEKLMTDVTRSLEAKNRDRFTQNLTVFRHEFHARPPPSGTS